MFIGLHRHSHYSKRDAIAKIPDMVKRIGELGQSAWALTDHGTTSGLMEAYKETIKYNKENHTNIKFIFGMEAYWIPNYYIKDRKASCHLILLAKNETGYKNLLKLSTIGYGNKGESPQNYFYTMRLTTEDIVKHKDGLIVSSACMGGILNPQTEEGWDKELAYERANTFKNIFGKDFYLEIQCATEERQKDYNKRIVQMSHDLDIPVYVTEDSHYVNQNEAHIHRRWLGLDLKPKDWDSWQPYLEYEEFWTPQQREKEHKRFKADFEKRFAYYQTDDYYIHSEQQVRDSLDLPSEVIDEAIQTTVDVANKCEQVHIRFGEKHYPVFDVPKGETPLSQMCKLVAKGYKEKVENKVDESLYPKYKEQIQHEITVLDKIGYTNYMLMTEDFVRGCHDMGIRTGIGRGSVGGCLVAYLMDITRIDPIKYGLIFERFAHDKRSSSADIH